MDDSAQLMILEIIFFATVVILALVLVYQLSPSSVVTNKYTTELRETGDNALRSISQDDPSEEQGSGYPSSKLVDYLITNAYHSMVADLHTFLPSTVLYNIYVADETQIKFWCNSLGETVFDDALEPIDPVTVSHCIVTIDPLFLTDFSDGHYQLGGGKDEHGASSSPRSDLFYMFAEWDTDHYEL